MTQQPQSSPFSMISAGVRGVESESLVSVDYLLETTLDKVILMAMIA